MTARRPGWVARCAAKGAEAARKAIEPHKASLARLADMPLTVLGVAGVDFAAWHLGNGWGWLVTGVSLVVVEHIIADPE